MSSTGGEYAPFREGSFGESTSDRMVLSSGIGYDYKSVEPQNVKIISESLTCCVLIKRFYGTFCAKRETLVERTVL